MKNLPNPIYLVIPAMMIIAAVSAEAMAMGWGLNGQQKIVVAILAFALGIILYNAFLSADFLAQSPRRHRHPLSAGIERNEKARASSGPAAISLSLMWGLVKMDLSIQPIQSMEMVPA